MCVCWGKGEKERIRRGWGRAAFFPLKNDYKPSTKSPALYCWSFVLFILGKIWKLSPPFSKKKLVGICVKD